MREDFYIFNRIFVEENEKNAYLIADHLTGLFSKPILDLSIKKYYKFKGWYEISFKTLEKDSIPNESLKENTKLLGQGWEYILGDSDIDFSGSAVWNPDQGSDFVYKSVKFADISVYLP